ncbi:hypothetical protein M231_03722 [Tremella mesenterica]|uniref:Serine/threonine-protein kinase Tel1 n=1 Tax=Tremella mesenterica TaxID=5217 RepID=A0A4Q1BMV0_TREME|nr:hypothetical protein M231_03722 [Tremella mesenterica]
MNTVSGLQSALRLYNSDKIKDRSQGAEHVREIFSNPENLLSFQEYAARDSGAGWIALFQCMFQVVVLEKKVTTRRDAKTSTLQAEKRLADAISLVRWMTERSVHLISKKPFMTLFSHLVSLLVHGTSLFQPSSLDYAKALNKLLSYPPHLNGLDQESLKMLLGICWAVMLNDEISVEFEWEDEKIEEIELEEGRTNTLITQMDSSVRNRPTTTQAKAELALLIPILLSSPSAPIIPPLPSIGTDKEGGSIGNTVLVKIHRFFLQNPIETPLHLPILRACDIVLAEFEFNCSKEMVDMGRKLLPHLVTLWGTRNKVLREQLVITLRILLPFVTHSSLNGGYDAGDMRDILGKLADGLAKETSNRNGIQPLDLNVIRLHTPSCLSAKSHPEGNCQPFETSTMTAGFDFSHECAMSWVILELYADCTAEAIQLHVGQVYSISDSSEPVFKRRRVETVDPINALLSGAQTGSPASKLLCLQVVIFLLERHSHQLLPASMKEIQVTLIDLLDNPYEPLQAWAFVGLSALCSIITTPSSMDDVPPLSSVSLPHQPQVNSEVFTRIWTHAIRKISLVSISRTACLAANTLISIDTLDRARVGEDIRGLLQNLEVQPPPYPFDSVCEFLSTALRITKSDSSLYSLNLEDRVIRWLEVWDPVNIGKGMTRLPQTSPSHILQLIIVACGLVHHEIPYPKTDELLPDCPIVTRYIHEAETRNLRDYILNGRIPPIEQVTLSSPSHPPIMSASPAWSQNESLSPLLDRHMKCSSLLTNLLQTLHADISDPNVHVATSPERIRRAVDVVVLALSFQATLQLNALQPDPSCLQSCSEILGALQPHLKSTNVPIPALLLVWSGLKPLTITAAEDTPVTWPILLRPQEMSGISANCLSLLPSLTQREMPTQTPMQATQFSGTEPITLQSVIWRMDGVQSLLMGLLDICQELIQDYRTASIVTPNAVNTSNEDNFGAVKLADTEAMPPSAEALECQRTSTALLKCITDFRLDGLKLNIVSSLPVKDLALLNALLASEGPRFIQLGELVTEAVSNGRLRLTLDAVDHILAAIEEVLTTYAYSRDTRLLQLALSFIGCSASVWLEADSKDSDIGERSIHLIKFMQTKIARGQIPAWQTRLELLRLFDRYVELDPSLSTWHELRPDSMEVDGSTDDTPSTYAADALVDIDARVRFRAATSASAALHHLKVGPSKEMQYYFSALGKQPGLISHWNSFLTHLLWKLNCCLSSSTLRPVALYHLLEIPLSTEAVNEHIRIGFQNVANRLGFKSVPELLKPYASITIHSLLQTGQDALRLPYHLFGWKSQKDQATWWLEITGPTIIAKGKGDYYSHLCSVAEVNVRQTLEWQFDSIGAIISGENALSGKPFKAPDVILSHLKSVLDKGVGGNLDILCKGKEELVVIRLFDILAVEPDVVHAVTSMEQVGLEAQVTQIYSDLLVQEKEMEESVTFLDPAIDVVSLLQCLQVWHQQFPRISRSKIVFNAVLSLSKAIHSSLLVQEQLRYLRSIAVAISIYNIEYKKSVILESLMREMIHLLPFERIWPSALSILVWAFDQITHVTGPTQALPDLLINLGEVYSSMLKQEAHEECLVAIRDWIGQSISSWKKIGVLRTSLEMAHILWPPDLGVTLSDWSPPNSADLIQLLSNQSSPDALQICKQLVTTTSTHNQSFKTDIFWIIKRNLPMGTYEHEGTLAFLDLLYHSEGQVAAPSLDAISGLLRDPIIDTIRQRYSSEPLTMIKIVFVTLIGQLMPSKNVDLRNTAIRVLSAMLPHISDAVDRNRLPGDLNDQVSFLIPSALSHQTDEHKNLGMLSESNDWIKLSSRPNVWCKELSVFIAQVLGIEDKIFPCIVPLLKAEGSQVKTFLPWLVQAILTHVAKHSRTTEDQVHILSQYFTAVLQSSMVATETIEMILNVILHLRHSRPPYRKDPLSFASWLKIDPILLSEAAIKCGAYTTALMFLESSLDDSSVNLDLTSQRVQKIMYEIYSNVEDPDGFYGIQATDLESALIRRLEHEGEHWRAFGINGANYQASIGSNLQSQSRPLNIINNLHDIGFDSLASDILATSRKSTKTPGADSLGLELAWRTGDWNLPLESDKTAERAFYKALRAVHRDRDLAAATKAVQEALTDGMTQLRGLGMERMAQVKQTTNNLLCLREIAHWLEPATQKALAEGDSESSVLTGLTVLPSVFGFRECERLMSTRLSLISAAKSREHQQLFGDLTNPQFDTLRQLEKSCRIRLSEMAREDGNRQAAINAITAVRHLEKDQTPSTAADDEFGHVLWSMGEYALATRHTEQMAKVVKPEGGRETRLAVLMGRIAHWSSVAQMKPAQDVKALFEEACTLATRHHLDEKETARLSHEYACFAHRQYISHHTSSELERLRIYAKTNPSVAELSATLAKSSKGKHSSSSALEARIKEAQEDEAALEALQAEIRTYVKTALRMFASALTNSNEFDDSMTRLCSLWLEHDGDEEVNKTFAFSLNRIPSHKFIFLGPQLSARLNRPKSPTIFNNSLNSLVTRIAMEHPFHILYQIITLANGVKPSKSGPRQSDIGAEGRGPAAVQVLQQISATDDTTTHPLAKMASVQMKVFADAAVPWCLYKEPADVKSTKEGEYGLPQGCPLDGLVKVNIPIPTIVPVVDQTGKYGDVPTLIRYRKRYRLLGGIHRPKRMTCLDSSGKQHYQLFKGEDEVRQDAVMEQVFEMTNDLLARDRKTKSRNLRFRTYNVIPLWNRTGVIEFVSNGQAIGDWLKPAHERYRKDIDHSPDSMRKQLHTVQERDFNSPKMTEVYRKLISQFRPVMRHFFTERHKDPMAWFAMRLNYSRSVAVTSMVGHVLGIGDRHCSNILIDQVQGELVHIDFGIVFEEQGRRLRIPEKVPFRLTNDIVDGFGITGVEGTFRRCSEHTLRVMRESSDLILTVLEVFKHDPLYAWTADSEKLQRAQGGRKADIGINSITAQDKADRILARVRNKLRQDSSVEYSVNQLIQEARDVENLSKIFVGE